MDIASMIVTSVFGIITTMPASGIGTKTDDNKSSALHVKLYKTKKDDH